MADLVAGRQGYADLKWRLLKTLELRPGVAGLLAHRAEPATALRQSTT